MTNAPKKTTWWLSFILAIVGLILYALAFLGVVPSATLLLDVFGFALVFIGWLLLAIGTRVKGL